MRFVSGFDLDRREAMPGRPPCRRASAISGLTRSNETASSATQVIALEDRVNRDQIVGASSARLRRFRQSKPGVMAKS